MLSRLEPRAIRKRVENRLPSIKFYLRYRRALKRFHLSQFSSSAEERDAHLRQFLERVGSKPGLQVALKKNLGRIGPSWTVIDKFDTQPDVDYHYDLMDMPFDDGVFHGVFCQSVLEHVSNPLKAIEQMRRVLAPGGLIFCQLPFNQVYHPDPQDYWRVSPEGLRLWMAEFEEIRCGGYSKTGSPLNISSYFYGRKT